MELEPSILVGGWATFYRIGGDTSDDIDLILGSDDMRDKVHSILDEVSESNHLQGRKWRGEIERIHVDIYLPYQSELGDALRLRVEELAKHTEALEGTKWRLLTIEAHAVSKMAALLDRPSSIKGGKDAREVLRLLERGVDAERACSILATASSRPLTDLPPRIGEVFDLLGPRSQANKAQRERIRHWKREWLDAIDRQARPGVRARPGLE